MEKELISDKEAACLLIAFVIGSSLIIGTGNAKNDSWIAGLLGFLMAAPMLAVYARTSSLFPGRDLFDILSAVFGKTAGRILTLVYVLYAFHLGALVLRNFGEFIKIVAMPETPLMVSILCMGLVVITAARLGVEVMSRTTAYFLPVIFAILIAVALPAIPIFHIRFLKPVLGNGFGAVLPGAFAAFSFPFCETVLFMGLFSALRTEKSPFKVYKRGMAIAALTIVLVTIRNIGILGNMLGCFYFPSYEAVSEIKIGDFLQRTEITVSFVFFIGILFKSSVCLLVASKGLSKLLNLKDYRSIVIQLGMLMIYFAYIVYSSSMEMKAWAFQVYPYYAFPVQVLIPAALWITAELKRRQGSV